MRHRLMGKQLSRSTSHRLAMRRNMAKSLIQHGAIRTTEAKAKELRPFVEHLITIARGGTLAARRRVIAELQDREMTDDEGEFLDRTVIQKLFDEIAPRYADRPGGYTRIIRLSERRIGDAGRQVVLQLVEEGAAETGDTPTAPSRRRRRARKRIQAAGGVAEEAGADAEEADDTEAAGETDEEASDEGKEPESAESAETEAPDADEGETDEEASDEQENKS